MWKFPLRKGSAGYRPYRPKDSYYRTGYAKTRANPRGYHRATDYSAPVGTIKQAPDKCRIVWKGRYGDLGLVVEVKLLAGPHKGRYRRICHCLSYTGKPIGTTLPKGYALARVGMTGRTSGPHDHAEVGAYPLKKQRDPRYNEVKYTQEAYDARRW